MKTMLKAQIVKILKKEKTKFKNTKLNFIVTDRINKMNGLDSEGNKLSGPFILCTAYGDIAETILDEFNEKDNNGKLISKKIDLYGTLMFYNKEKPIELEKDVSSLKLFEAFGYDTDDMEDVYVTIKFKKMIDVHSPLLIVKEFEYVDSNKSNKEVQAEDIEREIEITLSDKKDSKSNKKNTSNDFIDIEEESNKLLEEISELDI